jgi:predicted nucleic acid-binding protein
LDIFLLHKQSNPKETHYILDSNIWLPILGMDNDNISVHYKIFFDKIFNLNSSKILLCPIQLSEIINRLLRFHANKIRDKKYKNVKPDFSTYFKQEYRKSEACKIFYETIIDDLNGYDSHILTTSLEVNDFDTLTTFDPKKLDFNDNYLYLLAQQYSATIITDDADFYGLDVSIGTCNTKLYKEYTNSIKPKQ